MEGFYSATGEFIENNIDFFNNTAKATTKTTPNNKTPNATTKTTPNNTKLNVGQVLVSPDGKTTFGLYSDGNIYRTVKGTKNWCSSFFGRHALNYSPSHFIFNNNIITIYNTKNESIWTSSSQTNNTLEPGLLSVDNDTNVYIKVGNKIVWETGKYNSLMCNNEFLDLDPQTQFLVSPDGKTTFGLHSDGNIYRTVNGTKNWCSYFFGNYPLDKNPLGLQFKNNIIYTFNNLFETMWSSSTPIPTPTSKSIGFLGVQNDTNVCIYDSDNKLVWETGIQPNMNIFTFRQNTIVEDKFKTRSNNLVYVLNQPLGQIAIPNANMHLYETSKKKYLYGNNLIESTNAKEKIIDYVTPGITITDSTTPFVLYQDDRLYNQEFEKRKLVSKDGKTSFKFINNTLYITTNDKIVWKCPKTKDNTSFLYNGGSYISLITADEKNDILWTFDGNWGNKPYKSPTYLCVEKNKVCMYDDDNKLLWCILPNTK